MRAVPHSEVTQDGGLEKFILVFGRFYDVSREMKYYDDLHVFCTREMKWRKIEFDL